MLDQTINIGDIVILEDGVIDGIINENYGHLFRVINLYYANLLADIKLGKTIGYCYYNEYTDYEFEDYIRANEIDRIRKSTIDEVYDLATSIIFDNKEGDILEVFYSKTSQKYREIDDELRLYIDFIYSVFVKRLVY